MKIGPLCLVALWNVVLEWMESDFTIPVVLSDIPQHCTGDSRRQGQRLERHDLHVVPEAQPRPPTHLQMQHNQLLLRHPLQGQLLPENNYSSLADGFADCRLWAHKRKFLNAKTNKFCCKNMVDGKMVWFLLDCTFCPSRVPLWRLPCSFLSLSLPRLHSPGRQRTRSTSSIYWASAMASFFPPPATPPSWLMVGRGGVWPPLSSWPR